MSLDKAIASGKEKRKPRRKSAAFDASCRPHGGCPFCLGNRRHQRAKQEAAADDSVDDAIELAYELGKRLERDMPGNSITLDEALAQIARGKE